MLQQNRLSTCEHETKHLTDSVTDSNLLIIFYPWRAKENYDVKNHIIT